MLIKFRVKHPAIYKILKETYRFLLIFVITFVVVFAIFNGRAFYNQAKYTFKIGIEKSENFLKQLELPKASEKIYNIEDSLVIPKINVNAPIVFASTTDSKILFNKLEQGVVHYPTSTAPGEVGSTIILGHSSAYPWYAGDYGSVFALLGKLQPGDQIIVFYKKHKHTYTVSNKQVINDQVEIKSQNQKPKLILISCWPVGTAWKRIMIEAEKG